jgi:hypothetical protein
MKNFCTLADNNFYDKVAALNDSLYNFSKNYKLHLLCLDDQIYEKCKDKDNFVCYRIEDLLEQDPSLRKSKENNPSREAFIVSKGNLEDAKKIQFAWLLAPYFSWWCLENLEVEDILYIDADIYFYSSHETLYEHLNQCSIGIVEHRCSYNPDNGKYNVGIVYFKNDLDGYKCSSWWKNCLLFTNHQYYETHGKCGDQKYLELFPQLFNNVKVLDDNIGHLAPWNFLHHQYSENQIVWNGKKQNLLYCHFSNFKHNQNGYELAPRHGLKTAPNNFIKKIADAYYNALKVHS